jgi:hypothetical protein
MELAGMVAMGEYTDGCICQVKGEQLSINGVGRSALLGAAGPVAGSVGVAQQMREKQ